MAMRYQKGPQLVPNLAQIAEIGNYQVHAKHVGIGKGEAAIDDYGVVLVLNNGAVLADLTDAPNGHDANYTRCDIFYHRKSF